MEDKNDSSSFKFNVDDDEIPDLRFHKRKIKRTEEKKENKGILFPLFLFLLTVAILSVAYLDMRKQIEIISDSGTTEALKISTDLEARINLLSSQYETLEKSLNEKVLPVTETVSSLEKSVASLKDGLKKAEQSIEKISTSGMDKKELENIIAQTEKNLIPVRENLKSVESALKSLDEKFTKEVAGLGKSFKETKAELEQLQSTTSEPLSTEGEGIDKDAFEAALEAQQNLYQKKIDLLIENLSLKEEKIKALETKVEKGFKSFANKSTSSKSEPAKETEHDEPVLHPIDQIKPKPGTFVEQDIQ